MTGDEEEKETKDRVKETVKKKKSGEMSEKELSKNKMKYNLSR